MITLHVQLSPNTDLAAALKALDLINHELPGGAELVKLEPAK